MQKQLPTTRTPNRLSGSLAAALVVWVAVAVGGWYGISSYSFTADPDAVTGAPTRWPAESIIAKTDKRPTLVLILHPQCPCSRATVAELERLSTLVPLQLLPDICVVAAAPRSVGDLWWSTALLARAGRLPNAHILRDPGGVEAALFDARTSGTVLLFNTEGARLYAGGVTSARGHDGHNAGLQAVADLLIDHSAKRSAIPPFGCEVYREDADFSPNEELHSELELDDADESDDAQARRSAIAGELPA